MIQNRYDQFLSDLKYLLNYFEACAIHHGAQQQDNMRFNQYCIQRRISAYAIEKIFYMINNNPNTDIIEQILKYAQECLDDKEFTEKFQNNFEHNKSLLVFNFLTVNKEYDAHEIEKYATILPVIIQYLLTEK